MRQACSDDADSAPPDDGGELHALWLWSRRCQRLQRRQSPLPTGTYRDGCALVCDDAGDGDAAVDSVDNSVDDDGDDGDDGDEDWSGDE